VSATLIAIACGLGAAACFGTGDFLAQRLTHRHGWLPAMFAVQIASVAVLAGVAAVWHGWPAPSARQVLDVAGLGLINTLGMIGLYRAFESGKLSLVSPIAGSMGAFTVAFAWMFGRSPPAIVALGLLATIVGIVAASVVVEHDPASEGAAGEAAAGEAATNGVGAPWGATQPPRTNCLPARGARATSGREAADVRLSLSRLWGDIGAGLPARPSEARERTRSGRRAARSKPAVGGHNQLRGALGVGWALLSAIGFGWVFFRLGPASRALGSAWAIALLRVVAIVALVLLARPLRARLDAVWRPEPEPDPSESRTSPGPSSRGRTLAVACLDSAGMVVFAYGSSRGGIAGEIAVVAVLASSFPLVTIALARIRLGEALRWWQWLGVTLVLTGVAWVSAFAGGTGS
jgi:drug/metabolite transporter (DMT)-like permease